MISKEQYEQLLPHKAALLMLERSGEWVGGEAVYHITDSITGRKTKMFCDSCKGETLHDALNMIKKYEQVQK